MSSTEEHKTAINAEIKEIHTELAVLAEKRTRLLQREKELDDEFVLLEHGVKVGSIVVNNNGEKYKVSKIERTSWGKPWLKGYKRLKNGGWHKNSTHVCYDWELSDDPDAEAVK